MADTRKDCCKVGANLSAPVPMGDSGMLSFQRCAVCGCRHFRAIAQAITKRV